MWIESNNSLMNDPLLIWGPPKDKKPLYLEHTKIMNNPKGMMDVRIIFVVLPFNKVQAVIKIKQKIYFLS